MNRKPDNMPSNPNVIFTSIWSNWYDYLGVDTKLYPTSLETWRYVCERENIKIAEEYMARYHLIRDPMLPREPRGIYKSFRSFDIELSCDYIFTRR